jgi:hypothetical protein
MRTQSPASLARQHKLPSSPAWVLAEPIECQADNQQLYCLGSAHLAITQSEANQCIESMNQHLVPAGMKLYALEPALWLLALPSELSHLTQPLNKVLNSALGKTPALFTELQMLLHKHPINLAREQAGKPVIHACWLSGDNL